MLSDYYKLINETKRISEKEEGVAIGVMDGMDTPAFYRAVSRLSVQYTDMNISIIKGSHDEISDFLRQEITDINFNEMWQNKLINYSTFLCFQDDYYVILPSNNGLAGKESIQFKELLNYSPCILVSSEQYKTSEISFYHRMYPYDGEYEITNTLQDALLKVGQGKGFLTISGTTHSNLNIEKQYLHAIPIVNGGERVKVAIGIFYKQNRRDQWILDFSKYLVEEVRAHAN